MISTGRRRWAVAAGLGALMLGGLSLAGWAQAQGWRGEHMGGGAGLGWALHDLNLTHDQKLKIAEILTRHRDELRPKMQRMAESRRAMMELMTGESVDSAKLSVSVDESAAAGKELALALAAVHLEARAVLTPEQLTQLRQRRETFLARVKAHGEKSGDPIDRWIERLSH